MQGNLGAGPRIRKWRKDKGVKSFELAKLIRISQGSLSDIENSKSNPSSPTIVNFMKYTDIDIFWMLTGKTNFEPGTETDNKEPVLTINISPGQEILLKGKE